MKIKSVSVCWRYGVLGIYRDRLPGIWHVYPVPFLRITVGRSVIEDARQRADTYRERHRGGVI